MRLAVVAVLSSLIAVGGCADDRELLDPLNEATLASLPLPPNTLQLATESSTWDGTRSLVAFYATSEEEDDVLTFYCEELPRRGFSFTGGSVDCARQREPSARIAERILSFTDGETAQVELMLAASNIRELRSQVGVEPPGDRPTVFKLFVRRGRGFAP